MLEIELTDAIKKFVRTFGVARLKHLKHFFRDWEIGTYEHSIKHLMGNKILHRQVDDVVSFVFTGKLPSALPTYNGRLRCLDAMTGILKSSDVVWFDTADYPLDLRFLTVDDEIYDMTYVDQTNWTHKYSLFSVAWKKCVPPGQDDPYNHIAVVPTVEMAQQLRELPFVQFIVLDGNGGVQGIYDND